MMSYNAKSIQQLTFREGVRKRVGIYLGSADHTGVIAGLLELVNPMISKAIDAVAVIVIIPESNFGMFKQVLSKPVIIPHIAPTIKAIIVEVKGSTPFTIKVRHTAPPIRKLPSAVKSAKSNSL